MNRVVITGIGAITPLGNDVKTTWEKILRGESGIDYIKAFDTEKHTVKIAGEVKGFQPETKFDPKTLKRLDRVVQLSMWAAAEAIADSGIDFDQCDRNQVGVIIGSGIGGLTTWEEEHTKFIHHGPGRVSPFLIPMMIPDMTSGYVAIEWKLKGPNYTITSACASGAHSIGMAFKEIRYGKAQVVVSGGSEAPITPFAVAGFSNMRALSRNTADPKTVSKPFDRDRDGFVIAEGAGIFVMEELEFAKRRGARIYAEVAGFGATGDGFHITAPAPDGEGARRAMAMALDDAGCKPADIDYINAHGTSTDLNDKYEIKAIRDLFGDRAAKIAVNSTKSMIGHTLGAAGGVEGIIAILSIQNSKIHTTRNLVNVDPECAGVDFVLNGTRTQPVNCCLSNSLGFGGHNASICFKKYIP
jgi:3-oxoacyl-[acyl-carrier-protein] synthase II